LETSNDYDISLVTQTWIAEQLIATLRVIYPSTNVLCSDITFKSKLE